MFYSQHSTNRNLIHIRIRQFLPIIRLYYTTRQFQSFTTMELLYRQRDSAQGYYKNFLSKQINQDHNFRLSFISDYLICNHIHPIVYQGRWCNTMGHHDQFVGICCPPNADSHVHVGVFIPLLTSVIGASFVTDPILI